MSNIVTLTEVKNRELVDSSFYKDEVKKYEHLCLQLAKELKQFKIKNFSNEDYIKNLEENYKEAIKKLRELKVNIVKPTENNNFIQNIKEYLITDLGIDEKEIQKITDDNKQRLQQLLL